MSKLDCLNSRVYYYRVYGNWFGVRMKERSINGFSRAINCIKAVDAMVTDRFKGQCYPDINWDEVPIETYEPDDESDDE